MHGLIFEGKEGRAQPPTRARRTPGGVMTILLVLRALLPPVLDIHLSALLEGRPGCRWGG